MIEDRKICVVLPPIMRCGRSKELFAKSRTMSSTTSFWWRCRHGVADAGDTATGSAAGLLGRGSRLEGGTLIVLLLRCGQFS
jgi:hypothetical protein